MTALVALPARLDALGPPPPCRASPRNTVASSTVEPPARVNEPVTVEPLVLALEKPTPTGRTAMPTSDWKSLEPLRLLCRVAKIVPPDWPTVVGYVVCESGPGRPSVMLRVTDGLPDGVDSSVMTSPLVPATYERMSTLAEPSCTRLRTSALRMSWVIE